MPAGALAMCARSTEPWHLDRIDQRVGMDGSYDYGTATGEGTDIYVLDTGVRASHRFGMCLPQHTCPQGYVGS
jgi:hypothetical protein